MFALSEIYTHSSRIAYIFILFYFSTKRARLLDKSFKIVSLQVCKILLFYGAKGVKINVIIKGIKSVGTF